MVRKYDKFIVLTEEDKPDWGQLNNIQVIPNANTFETEQFSLLEKKVVLAAGRYGYQKNFEDLIHAWHIVHSNNPDWILNIRGQGLDNLQPLIDSLSLNSSISIGHSNDMLKECLNSSIFALSSRYEGLPMVILETQACGLPTVSYTCKCGPRDIITDGENGFLVDTGDINGLAQNIIRLIEDESLRKKMGESAKMNSKRFSENVIMKKWDDLFSSLVGKV